MFKANLQANLKLRGHVVMHQLSARDSMSCVNFQSVYVAHTFHLYTFNMARTTYETSAPSQLLLVLELVGCKTVGYHELINVECQSYSSYTIGTSYIGLFPFRLL